MICICTYKCDFVGREGLATVYVFSSVPKAGNAYKKKKPRPKTRRS